MTNDMTFAAMAKMLQTFFTAQEERKAMLGKQGYSERKFWEEVSELGEEIEISEKAQELTPNFINELGDVLFGTLGNPALAEELMARMEFNFERAMAYKDLDGLKRDAELDGYSNLYRKLNLLKLKPSGWETKDGSEIDHDILEMLPAR
ncbi:MAG: hypothetical protein DRQ62_16190 [Gammaproteobacteria bacterium]|nr:MAG: hypothetical protein DRQ62_16190 [Gammaproteobacteria bacterium]